MAEKIANRGHTPAWLTKVLELETKTRREEELDLS